MLALSTVQTLKKTKMGMELPFFRSATKVKGHQEYAPDGLNMINLEKPDSMPARWVLQNSLACPVPRLAQCFLWARAFFRTSRCYR